MKKIIIIVNSCGVGGVFKNTFQLNQARTQRLDSFYARSIVFFRAHFQSLLSRSPSKIVLGFLTRKINKDSWFEKLLIYGHLKYLVCEVSIKSQTVAIARKLQKITIFSWREAHSSTGGGGGGTVGRFQKLN